MKPKRLSACLVRHGELIAGAFMPANEHSSETAMDDWIFDRTLDNSGDLQMLEELSR
jgi:hypothetical protein